MLRPYNGRLRLAAGDLDYIRFGDGEKLLVMIPGVGDGLKTVRGMALPFALLYRALTGDFTVYAFSRGLGLAPHTSTRAMAGELGYRAEIVPPVMDGDVMCSSTRIRRLIESGETDHAARLLEIGG